MVGFWDSENIVAHCSHLPQFSWKDFFFFLVAMICLFVCLITSVLMSFYWKR